MTPHVMLFKTEAEAQDECRGKVIHYNEFYADSEQEVDQLIAANRTMIEQHIQSLNNLK